MECKNCGTTIEEDARFCEQCGQELSEREVEGDGLAEEANKGKKKGRKKWLVTGSVVAGILLVGVVVLLLLGFKMQEQALQAFGEEYATMKQTLEGLSLGEEKKTYDQALGEIEVLLEEKRVKVLRTEMEDMKDLMAEAVALDGTIKKGQQQKGESTSFLESYFLINADKKLSFENELTLLGEALTAGDGKAIEEGCKNLATLESAIIEESKQEIAALRTELEARDTSRALTGEMLILNGFKLQVEEALNKEDYPGALEALKEWKALIQVVDANSDYELTVRQMDVSEYPKVKVYISLENIYTGETVANLKPAQFYLAEEIGGTGIYQEKALSKLVQLDELEALNVCMVADVSGSMMGEPIYTLKDVMTRFANTVQYGIGDKVSLISFANSVYVESNFTSNGAQVTGAIQNMELGDMTAFYDALYTAINYTIAQQGAKCIIAFTDGMDNYSQCTPEMVTALANRYGIPIYIIGVGDSIDEGIMHYIADSTGGFYRSVYSIDSMAEIYSTIYRKQKEMYVAEYETDLAKEDTLSHALYMAYADRNVVARNEYYYIPAILKEGIEGGAKLFVDGFVIYDSDSRYLTIADLERLTSEELRLARNEIYARKGRKFVDQALQTYFNQCSWYMGSVEASDFKEDMLNDYEKANAYFIRDYERLRNGE